MYRCFIYRFTKNRRYNVKSRRNRTFVRKTLDKIGILWYNVRSKDLTSKSLHWRAPCVPQGLRYITFRKNAPSSKHFYSCYNVLRKDLQDKSLFECAANPLLRTMVYRCTRASADKSDCFYRETGSAPQPVFSPQLRQYLPSLRKERQMLAWRKGCSLQGLRLSKSDFYL